MSINRQKLSGFSGNSSIDRKVINTSVDYVMQAQDDNVIVNAAGHTVHLPLGGGNSVAIEHVIYASGVSTTIDGNGSLINGAASVNLGANEVAHITWDPVGQAWVAGFMAPSSIIVGSITLDATSAAVVPGDWICSGPTGGAAVKALPAPLAASGQVLGIALTAGSAGQTIEYAKPGSVIPAAQVPELGAGTCSLVAITSTARSGRVFAYGQGIGGIADTSGNLTVLPGFQAPGRNAKTAWIPETFGAVGDGVTDDTAAIEAMFAAGLSADGILTQRDYHFSKTYAISSTIVFFGTIGGHITGEKGSAFVWIGGYDNTNTNPIPMIWMKDCQFMVWEDIQCVTNSPTTHPCAEGWRTTTQTGSPGAPVSLSCMWNNCGATGVEIGWRIGGGNEDFNNDSHVWLKCTATCQRWGWELQDHEEFCQQFYGCVDFGSMIINSGPPSVVGIAGGSLIVTGGTPTMHFFPVGLFGPKDVGKIVEITDDAGTLTRTTITACPAGGTTATLAVNVPNNCTSGHAGSGVNYGSQGAVNCGASFPLPGQASGTGGSFTWLGGQVGGNIDADFVVGSQIPITIRDISSEASRRLLRSPTAFSTSLLIQVLDASRIDTELALSGVPFIFWPNAGLFRISNCIIGDGTNAPAAFTIGNTSGPLSWMFVLDNTRIGSNIAIGPGFNGLFPTTVVGKCTWNQFGGSIIQIGEVATNDGTVSGAYTVDFSLRQTHWLMINGDTTLTLANVPEGIGSLCRLILISQPATGPHKLTWPTSPEVIWCGSEPAPFLSPLNPGGFAPVVVEFSQTRAGDNPITIPFILARVITPDQGAIPLVLVGGADNPDVAILNAHGSEITGPGAAYSISSLVAPLMFTNNATSYADGFEHTINSTVAQTLTIKDASAALGTAANRVLTGSGADIVCHANTPTQVKLRYDGTVARWRVLSVWPLP